MANQAQRVKLTVVGVLAFAALMLGVFVAQHLHFSKKIDTNKFHGTYLEQPRPVNSFQLTGIDQKPFTNDSLKGQWTMVFFGFTNCGYVCPTTMAELGKMYRLLEEKGIKTMPKVVMVSIDPERDSLDKLGHYVTAFDKHFYGARGDNERIKTLTREMGIAYAKVALSKDDAENYDIQHSGAVMLFNPKGELNAFFTTPHQADLLAEDYIQLVS
ncbi:SCO family protein [Legionella israelensis]|uniref:SCO family protein n=1 Tax=Legionella israelensis TaxID=454 RepID=A0AAX1EJ61_9GAMM|nr:SCO family protein [Legionella israelensis]QBR85064.1 SCO family protein [Legionella israelensis]